MALIQCHECRGKISDHARTCPHCGAPVIATIKRRQKAELQFLLIKTGIIVVFAIFSLIFLRHLFNQVMAPLNKIQQQQTQPR